MRSVKISCFQFELLVCTFELEFWSVPVRLKDDNHWFYFTPMFRVTKGCVQSKDDDDDDEFICEKIHPDYLFGHCRPEVPFEKLRPNLKYSSVLNLLPELHLRATTTTTTADDPQSCQFASPPVCPVLAYRSWNMLSIGKLLSVVFVQNTQIWFTTSKMCLTHLNSHLS